MGCLQSRRVSGSHTENAPRLVFCVTNLDESGRDLSAGQLQITDSDIVLYREGVKMTCWPLHSLRRYGYEGAIFSFESGRRCETGEGIYAFRCRRAPIIFHVLQEQIHQRNLIHEDLRRMARGANRAGAESHGAQPISMQLLASVIPRTGPSTADVQEATPLNLQPRANTSQDVNLNPITGIDNKRENNNNQSGTSTETKNAYCNDINRDLAILRNTLLQESEAKICKEIEDDAEFLKSIGNMECKRKEAQQKAEKEAEVEKEAEKKIVGSLSPTLIGNPSDHSHLTPKHLEQQVQESRMYMNLNTTTNRALPDRNSYGPTTPTTMTPKAVEYCNINLNVRPETNTYANLALREFPDSMSSLKHMLHYETPSSNPKVSESDTATSMSPLEDMEVNYAILDIDSNRDSTRSLKDLVSPDRTSMGSSRNESTASGSSAARVRLLSQPSLEGPAPCIGYTTIDFDKTVALTSVAAGTDLDTDGARKTRHNSTSLVNSSPTSVDKNKGFL